MHTDSAAWSPKQLFQRKAYKRWKPALPPGLCLVSRDQQSCCMCTYSSAFETANNTQSNRMLKLTTGLVLLGQVNHRPLVTKSLTSKSMANHLWIRQAPWAGDKLPPCRKLATWLHCCFRHAQTFWLFASHLLHHKRHCHVTRLVMGIITVKIPRSTATLYISTVNGLAVYIQGWAPCYAARIER